MVDHASTCLCDYSKIGDTIAFSIVSALAYGVHFKSLYEEVIDAIQDLEGWPEEHTLCLRHLLKITEEFLLTVKQYKDEVGSNFHEASTYMVQDKERLLEQYFAILDYAVRHQDEIEETVLLKLMLKHMLPILNDVVRVNYCFSKTTDALDIEVLDNEHKLHCEVNVLEKFGSNIDYIGISKLSCFLCHVILESKGIHYNEASKLGISNAYAGIHGLFFYYDPRHLLEDEDIANGIVEYMEEVITRHRADAFREALAKSNKSPIDFFLEELSEEDIRMILQHNDFQQLPVQHGDYCLEECDQITGFHPNPDCADISLSYYNSVLLGMS